MNEEYPDVGCYTGQQRVWPAVDIRSTAISAVLGRPSVKELSGAVTPAEGRWVMLLTDQQIIGRSIHPRSTTPSLLLGLLARASFPCSTAAPGRPLYYGL